MAGVLPPWHDGRHGSPVWSAKCWLAGNGRRSAEGLAQGALPLDPGLRACGAQGHRGLAGWPGFYRRGTTGATARRSGRRNAGWPEMAAARRKVSRKGHCPLTPDCAPQGRRGVEDMQVGRGFTAVARRVPRLAGLVGEMLVGRYRPARGSDSQPQSSSLALPCQILVSVDGCRSLTACGGCAHWATVNFSNKI